MSYNLSGLRSPKGTIPACQRSERFCHLLRERSGTRLSQSAIVLPQEALLPSMKSANHRSRWNPSQGAAQSEVPQRQALAQVTEVSTSDIKGEQELVLDCIEPDVVEVGVRRVGVEDEEEPHPVVSLQGEGLTGEQQKKMNSLLDRWRSVFSQHEEDFGRTNAVKHQIPTGSAPPSRERLPQLVMARTDNVSVEDGETWRERQAKDPELVQIRQWKEQGTTCPEARGERSLADLPRKDGPPKQRPDRGSPQAALLLAKND
uniref:Uncharacterized protein n=1 Tax=Knipowitschia caucasica TaxID=637954 RepID=A0AAV2LI60_KNICA